ncbi:MAG: hypothetical protein WD766_10060 [Gemmatimonadota bacterium]
MENANRSHDAVESDWGGIRRMDCIDSGMLIYLLRGFAVIVDPMDDIRGPKTASLSRLAARKAL